MLVVYGDADLELAPRGARRVLLGVEGEDDGGVAGLLVLGRAEFLGEDHALLHPVLGGVDVEVFDADALLHKRLRHAGEAVVVAHLLQDVLEEEAVEPDAVRGVAGVLLALQPVGVEFDDAHLPDGVRPDEQVPRGEERRGLRPHIGEEEAAHLLHGVGGEADPAVLERIGARLHRRLDARSRRVVEPAMVGAAEAALVGNAPAEVDGAVEAAPADEADGAGLVAVAGEVFSEDADGLDGVFVQFGARQEGNPVPAQQLAARRAGPDAGQPLVLLLSQHRGASLRTARRKHTMSARGRVNCRRRCRANAVDAPRRIRYNCSCLVVGAERPHPFPSRTRK